MTCGSLTCLLVAVGGLALLTGLAVFLLADQSQRVSSQSPVKAEGCLLDGVFSACQVVRVSLPAENKAVNAIESLLPEELTSSAHVIIVEYNPVLPVEELGRMSDLFLQSRPQWMVYHEDYPWQRKKTLHLIYLRQINIDEPLMQLAELLNHECDRPLVFKGYHDFDEYGNEHYNIAGFISENLGTITLIHIKEHAKFIDDGFCPNEINKYNCAFLPMTRCPLPKHYLECPNYDEACTPESLVYSNASSNAIVIYKNYNNKKFRKTIERPPIEEFSAVGDAYYSHAVFDFEHVSKEKYSVDGIGSLFYTGIFFRRNYEFRNRTAKMIHDFRQSTKPYFGPNDECVAIHIRRHDRVKPGFDMIKYCNEFVRNSDDTCYNRTNGKKIQPDCRLHWDYDYGCPSAVPFGGITMQAYLNAAELLLNNRTTGFKTVFIITDDGAWVEQESRPFRDEWAIQILPAQPMHRSRATINGVTLFSSIELVQQCSGLVGHSSSAFTILLRVLMCTRHGPRNGIRFGECPKFYDFGVLHN